MDELCKVVGDMPPWFFNAMTLAMLAPTAVNQQKFLFTLDNDTVRAKALRGFYSKTDLGIAKYHFEIGAGDAEFKWSSNFIIFLELIAISAPFFVEKIYHI